MKMPSLVVKICGMTSPDDARALAARGIDYLGCIFYPHSPRNVQLAKAVEIMDAIKLSSTQIVPVFVENTLDEMQTIIDTLKPQHIQLHGAAPQAHHQQLPEALHRIFVLSFKSPLISPELLVTDYALNSARDFLLFDSCQLAQNLAAQLAPYHNFRYFIAGRITPENINALLHNSQPYGIDLASGVETSPGIKDLAKIDLLLTRIQERR